MAAVSPKTLRVCSNGHRYYKSSDCPTCPVCEQGKQPGNAFLASLSAPARRALTNEGITSAEQLSLYTEKAILKLHGIGPASLPALRLALATENLGFKSQVK